MLEKYKDIKNKLESVRGQQDYTGTCSFWQLFTMDGNNLTLYERDKYHSSEKNIIQNKN